MGRKELKIVNLRLFIPVETGNQYVAFTEIKEEVLRAAGGMTITKGEGYYGDYEELVNIIEVWTSAMTAKIIIAYAVYVLRHAGESSIGYTLNGEPTLVEPNLTEAW